MQLIQLDCHVLFDEISFFRNQLQTTCLSILNFVKDVRSFFSCFLMEFPIILWFRNNNRNQLHPPLIGPAERTPLTRSEIIFRYKISFEAVLLLLRTESESCLNDKIVLRYVADTARLCLAETISTRPGLIVEGHDFLISREYTYPFIPAQPGWKSKISTHQRANVKPSVTSKSRVPAVSVCIQVVKIKRIRQNWRFPVQRNLFSLASCDC